jgi:hypothetical protein
VNYGGLVNMVETLLPLLEKHPDSRILTITTSSLCAATHPRQPPAFLAPLLAAQHACKVPHSTHTPCTIDSLTPHHLSSSAFEIRSTELLFRYSSPHSPPLVLVCVCRRTVGVSVRSCVVWVWGCVVWTWAS